MDTELGSGVRLSYRSYARIKRSTEGHSVHCTPWSLSFYLLGVYGRIRAIIMHGFQTTSISKYHGLWRTCLSQRLKNGVVMQVQDTKNSHDRKDCAMLVRHRIKDKSFQGLDNDQRRAKKWPRPGIGGTGKSTDTELRKDQTLCYHEIVQLWEINGKAFTGWTGWNPWVGGIRYTSCSSRTQTSPS